MAQYQKVCRVIAFITADTRLLSIDIPSPSCLVESSQRPLIWDRERLERFQADSMDQCVLKNEHGDWANICRPEGRALAACADDR